MQMVCRHMVALLALAAAPLEVAAVSLNALAHKSRRAPDGGMLQPLHFKQELLVCNAYPSDSPVLIMKNGRESIAGAKNALAFQECRYMNTRVNKRDRLQFDLRDKEIVGTFEVGEVPSTDSLLLLVLEKRPGASKVSFQSFAFPSTATEKTAQLAVINAFVGNSSSAHLKMEDHIDGNETQTVTKRVEVLNFNRVYTVDAGGYDVSISDVLELNGTRRNLRLSGSSNYVVMRTGGESFKESLVVYPDSPIPSRGAHSTVLGAAALVWSSFVLASLII